MAKSDKIAGLILLALFSASPVITTSILRALVERTGVFSLSPSLSPRKARATSRILNKMPKMQMILGKYEDCTGDPEQASEFIQNEYDSYTAFCQDLGIAK